MSCNKQIDIPAGNIIINGKSDNKAIKYTFTNGTATLETDNLYINFPKTDSTNLNSCKYSGIHLIEMNKQGLVKEGVVKISANPSRSNEIRALLGIRGLCRSDLAEDGKLEINKYDSTMISGKIYLQHSESEYIFCAFNVPVIRSFSDISPSIKKRAIDLAEKWLILVDNLKYSESWEMAAEYLKSTVNEEEWKSYNASIRQPLGKLISRELKTMKQSSLHLPGMPDGEYIGIIFKTSFENSESNFETITLMKQKDGSWKVGGYHIK